MSLAPLGGLHDAPIDRVWTEGGTTFVTIDAFAWSPTEDESPPSLLRIIGAQQVTANDQAAEPIQPLSGDGEIYSCSQQPDGVELVVIWHVYQPHRSETVVYRFIGATAELSARSALDTPGAIG